LLEGLENNVEILIVSSQAGFQGIEPFSENKRQMPSAAVA